MSTAKLLSALRFTGLNVSGNMLSQDVKHGFLPPSESETRGKGRIWNEWEVRRAVYLYRLRNLGIDAAVIRVLLFLRDGWGWESVKPLCIAGFKTFVDFQTAPVRRRYRKPDKEDVRDLLLRDAPTKPKLALFNYGLGYFAEPLKGGTLQEFFGQVKSFAGINDDSDDLFKPVEQFFAECGFTYERAIKVIAESTEEDFQLARPFFRDVMHSMRGAVFQHWKISHEPRQSTNLITLCNANKAELQILFRKHLKKITLAQFLAAGLGIIIIVDEFMGLNQLMKLTRPA
jgi:hypothetical protein